MLSAASRGAARAVPPGSGTPTPQPTARAPTHSCGPGTHSTRGTWGVSREKPLLGAIYPGWGTAPAPTPGTRNISQP